MFNLRKIRLVRSGIFFLFFLLPLIALAYEWEVPFPAAPGGATLDENSIDSVFTYIYNFGLGLGGLFAFFRLVQAGILWGGEAGNVGSKAQAMGIIQGTIFGLLLLLFSWVILNTINPQILNLNIGNDSGGTLGAISKSFLLQSKPDKFGMIANPSQRYSRRSVTPTTLPAPVGGVAVGGGSGFIDRPEMRGAAIEVSETGEVLNPIPGCLTSLSNAGLVCDSFSGDCSNSLSCSLVGDLLELKDYTSFLILPGTEMALSHVESRAVDIKLHNSSPNELDSRDVFIMKFLNGKSSACAEELFAPSKFGKLCLLAGKTIDCANLKDGDKIFSDHLHYAIKRECVF